MIAIPRGCREKESLSRGLRVRVQRWECIVVPERQNTIVKLSTFLIHESVTWPWRTQKNKILILVLSAISDLYPVSNSAKKYVKSEFPKEVEVNSFETKATL